MNGTVKLLLHAEDVNYRLFVDVPENERSVSLNTLEVAIRETYKEIEQYLDKNRFIIEVYDNDFAEYVRIDENEPIENLSKLRVKRISKSDTIELNSFLNQTELFKENPASSGEALFHQNCAVFENIDFNNTATQHKSKKSSKKAKKVIELCASSSSLTENANGNYESSELDSFFKTNPYLEQQFMERSDLSITKNTAEVTNDNGDDGDDDDSNYENVSKLLSPVDSGSVNGKYSGSDDYVLKRSGKKKIFRSNFWIKDFEKKEQLASVVRAQSKQFSKHKDNMHPVWNKVSQKLAKKGINYTSKKCRGLFQGLFGQYMNILNNLRECTSDDAQRLWPLFKLFHYSLNLKPFKVDIAVNRAAFDNHPKTPVTNQLCKSDVEYHWGLGNGTPPCAGSIEFESEESVRSDEEITENLNNFNDEIETSVDLSAIHLIQVVADNINFLRTETHTEEDFWQKIAYEMSTFRDPLEDSTKVHWKIMFYSILRNIMWGEPCSAQIRKLFEGLDVGFFLNTTDKEMSDFLAGSYIPVFEVSDVDSEEKFDDLDDERMQSQKIFLTWVRKCHKIVSQKHDEEMLNKYWIKIRRKLLKKGYQCTTDVSLRDYLNEFIAVYFKALETCTNYEDAIRRWPMFKYIHNIDLSPFVDDCDYYQRLRSQFNE